MPMPEGPVEYLLLRFPGNHFKGEIAPALAELVDSGTVRIIDLAFIIKDGEGNVTFFEYDDTPEGSALAELDGEAGGLFSEEDIEAAAEALDPDSSGLFILWEDVWAAKFAAAVRDAGGEIVAGERLPRAVVAELMSAIESQG